METKKARISSAKDFLKDLDQDKNILFGGDMLFRSVPVRCFTKKELIKILYLMTFARGEG